MTQRVVITGIGPLSSGARGRQAFWDLLGGSEDAARRPFEAPGAIGDLKTGADDRRLRNVDRVSRLGLAAAALAIEDAGLGPESDGLHDMGVAFGSGFGCVATNAEYLRGILTKGPRFGNPVVFQNTVPNAAAGYISVAWELCGPTATFCSGAVAGLEAFEFAAHQIAEERCAGMLVVAAEELSPWLGEFFCSRGELSTGGEPRPFDRRRDGVVLGEGACGLFVESLAHATGRGARVYAEVLSSSRASDSMGEKAAALGPAVDRALALAGIGGDHLDAVFAGASGSIERDICEAYGLRRSLGRRADEIPVSCPKGALGETVGGSGCFGLAAAALSLWTGQVPPTTNLREPDPTLGLNLVCGSPQRRHPQTAMVSIVGDDSNAFATVLRRCGP